MSAKPLSGLKVLEFSHTVMGPCAGLLFADLGADVVKVEPAPMGDHTRGLPGFTAGFFAGFNRNKRSIAIDLKRGEGQAVAHRLIAQADVLLENYGPGTMERLNCGWEQVRQVNPRLVYLVLKGFLAGPYEQRPALDEVVQFMSGICYMTGPAGQPLRAGVSLNDIGGAVFGVAAALAALRERDATGQGQRVGSALFENAAFLMAPHLAGIAVTGIDAMPMPSRRGAWAIYNIFDTSDRQQIFLGVTSDQQWERFTAEFGLDDLYKDPRLTTNFMRVHERGWLIPAIQAALKPFTKAEIVERCVRINVSIAPVGKPADLFDDPQLKARGGMLDVAIKGPDGETRMTPLPALPVEFGEERVRPGLERQPPGMGEHNGEILAAAGFSAAEIEQLARSGVIASMAGAPAASPAEAESV
jgi:crotonobetainyl-CoA:carnitine CoA-transferase CaiB-like acyl-CoA transferase